jgi:hypothetical protein
MYQKYEEELEGDKGKEKRSEGPVVVNKVIKHAAVRCKEYENRGTVGQAKLHSILVLPSSRKTRRALLIPRWWRLAGSH